MANGQSLWRSRDGNGRRISGGFRYRAFVRGNSAMLPHAEAESRSILVRTLRILCTLGVVAGGCRTGRALYLHAKAELAGIPVRRAWEQGVQSGRPRAPWPGAGTHPV